MNGKPTADPGVHDDALRETRARLDRLAAEHEQLKAQFLQAQKMEAVGRLASGIAHDFKNVLTLIAGYADRLQQQSDTAATREPVAEIRSACQRAIVLAEQLLSYSRREAAAQSPLSLNTILADSGRMLQRMLPAHVDLSIRSAPGLGLVMANAGQMHQVLMNLVLNARDAMPSGGRLSVEVQNIDVAPGSVEEASGARPGPHVRLTVADTGIGMDDETCRRALEPFFTTKAGKLGTGLGLSTVHSIVTDCRGRIVIETARRVGTTVRIYLPRLEPEPAGESAASSQGRSPVAAPRRSRILVVDEDPAIRRLLVDLLTGQGYHVEAAAGVSAFAEAASHDLLIVDLVTLDRAEGPVPPLPCGRSSRVLGMSSATAGAAASTHGLEIGVTLAKPIAPRQLLRAVRDMLEAD